MRRQEVLYNIVKAIELRDYASFLINGYINKIKDSYFTHLGKCNNALAKLKELYDKVKEENNEEVNEFFSYYNDAKSQVLLYEKTIKNIK